MKTFVFDFDGVIGDTFEAYATFLSKFMKISPQKARLYMREHSLNNGKQSIIKMFVKNFYMQRFEKYLLNQEDLLFEDVLKNIHQLPGSKYIISRNHSRICTDLLADNVHEFTQIYGYDTCRTKVKADRKSVV